MKKELEKYLPHASAEFWLIDEVTDAVAKKWEAGGDGALSEPEKVVGLVWQAHGVIENGGLPYFFEHDFNVERVAAAYEAVGLRRQASILRQAVAKFPNGRRPRDFKRCMQFVGEHEDFFNSLSEQFIEMPKEMEDVLAAYVRKHPEAFSEFIR